MHTLKKYSYEYDTPKETMTPSSTGTHRVLLVEDYAPNVLVATLFLEQFGYQCDVANNGQQALDCLLHHRYSAVLMDVQMDDIDGYETTRRLRQLEQAQGRKPVRVIGMTAHAMAGDRERCIEAGMDDYISKPFDPDILQEKLAEACALVE